MDLLRKASTVDPSYPPVLLVSLASVEANSEFFATRWPAARVVADPQKVVFEAFGRRRGTFLQLFGPRVFLRAIQALWKGYGAARPQGDPMVMPGAFVVRGEQVLWAHPTRDVSDHPDFAALPRAAGLR